jgi:uncharacterized protein (TIGR03083 family)
MPAEIALDAVYRDARERIAGLAGDLSDDELASRLPGCPEWTAHDLLAHVAGVAADAVAGRTEGAPGPTWTAAQVRLRKDSAVPDILAEWEEAGPHIEAGLAARRISIRIVFDVLTHEADLREGLGQPSGGRTERW